MPTSKRKYLENQNVECFIEFITSAISRPQNAQPVHQFTFARAFLTRDAPAGYAQNHLENGTCVIHDLEDALTKYFWAQQDFNGNHATLEAIALELRAANDDAAVRTAVCNCLFWGNGNRRGRLFQANMGHLDRVAAQAHNHETHLARWLDFGHRCLASTRPRLAYFGRPQEWPMLKMNSGFTKVFALRYPNFIIYDSRVAAALGFLVVEYLRSKEIKTVPTELAFRIPPGAGSGSWAQRRTNPSYGNYVFHQVAAGTAQHAEWNVKANWILSEVVNTQEFDDSIGGCEDDRLRRLEAALFMLGYDVNRSRGCSGRMER